MQRYVWLSYPLAIDGPRPPAIPAPELSALYTVARDGASVQILRVANHTARTSMRPVTLWRELSRSRTSARRS